MKGLIILLAYIEIKDLILLKKTENFKKFTLVELLFEFPESYSEAVTIANEAIKDSTSDMDKKLNDKSLRKRRHEKDLSSDSSNDDIERILSRSQTPVPPREVQTSCKKTSGE